MIKSVCRYSLILVAAILLQQIIFITSICAEESSDKENLSIPIPETKISYNWFLAYVNGKEDGVNIDEFQVRRGYINITSKFNSWISTRITPDLTVDREGDGEGDLEMRFKYLYVDFKMSSKWIFTKPNLEFGLVHRPWLDFEQKINRYRSQGTHFLERNGLFNSADNGITFMSLLGGEMDSKYKKEVNSKYPGRHGSIALGIYNGGGYHAIEKNRSKVFESRLTLRPFPESVPGMQVSWLLKLGKGNTEAEPDFNVNAAMLSYERRWSVLAAQYYRGKGNSKGSAVLANGDATPQEGYSIFGEYHIPFTNFGMIGRYDYFDYNRDLVSTSSKRTIAGLVYYLPVASKIILDIDTVEFETSDTRETIGKFTVEVNF